jgi:hypothetical protein
MSGDDPACTWLRGSSNPPARTGVPRNCVRRFRGNAPGLGSLGSTLAAGPAIIADRLRQCQAGMSGRYSQTTRRESRTVVLVKVRLVSG